MSSTLYPYLSSDTREHEKTCILISGWATLRADAGTTL